MIDTENNTKKEVQIKIKGVHKNINSDIQNISSSFENIDCQELAENIVETECSGFYQKIGRQIYIKYVEEIETQVVSNNLLKIDNNIDEIKIEIIKKGIVDSKMTFIEKVKTENIYNTPYGKINMMIDTKSIHIKTKEDRIFVNIKYGLFMENGHMSMSEIDIIIESL